MTVRRRQTSVEDSSVDDLLQTDSPSDSDNEQQRPDLPVKSFFLPNSWLTQFLSVPSQIIFAIAGLMGIANFARQIVRIRPKRSGVLQLRDEGGSEPVAQWIEENVPSLQGVFKPSWWLPKSVSFYKVPVA
jgi:hypothetical protein